MTSTMQSRRTTPNVSGYSGVMMFFGIVLIALGSLAVMSSVIVTVGAVLLFGGLLIAAGIAELIHVFGALRKRGIRIHILSALAYLFAGFLMIARPVLAAISLSLVLGSFFIATGCIRCFYALTLRSEKTWGWFLFGGIVNLVFGLLVAILWPPTALWVVGLFIGIEMLVHGSAWLALSFVLRENERHLLTTS